jgi:glycosyltransferase involved in cell wall biosynthesis
LDLDYAVDVIDYNNNNFVPQKKYSIFVSARTNFQRIAELLNSDCLKIVHLDTAHWLFNNTAAYKRCLELQQRKKLTVASIKWVEPNWAVEQSDFATLLGNNFTLGTYNYSNKKIFKVPIAACAMYPSPEKKDFNACRKNFLWFGSNGFVHKGLDLALDVFKEMKDFRLFVCGPIEQEKEFEKAYGYELYSANNIHTIGWVDVEGPKFNDLITKCVGLIYPSCSEGQSGAVVTCLHAGLIPITSYESGVDLEQFGIILENCSHESIANAIKAVSELPTEELKSRAVKAWEYARHNHTRESFSREYKKTIEVILKSHSTLKSKPKTVC